MRHIEEQQPSQRELQLSRDSTEITNPFPYQKNEGP